VTRLIISIALASGGSPSDWLDQDWRTIVTAAELLSKQNEKEDEQGRQMSG
jgi:hypothetical protein